MDQTSIYFAKYLKNIDDVLAILVGVLRGVVKSMDFVAIRFGYPIFLSQFALIIFAPLLFKQKHVVSLFFRCFF